MMTAIASLASDVNAVTKFNDSDVAFVRHHKLKGARYVSSYQGSLETLEDVALPGVF